MVLIKKGTRFFSQNINPPYLFVYYLLSIKKGSYPN